MMAHLVRFSDLGLLVSRWSSSRLFGVLIQDRFLFGVVKVSRGFLDGSTRRGRRLRDNEECLR